MCWRKKERVVRPVDQRQVAVQEAVLRLLPPTCYGIRLGQIYADPLLPDNILYSEVVAAVSKLEKEGAVTITPAPESKRFNTTGFDVIQRVRRRRFLCWAT